MKHGKKLPTKSFRPVIAAILLIFLAASSEYALFAKMIFPRLKNDWPVYEYGRRFAALKKELPSNGVVGYISDEPTGSRLIDISSTSMYYLTQYALSPLVVDNSPDHKYVVGNFRGDGSRFFPPHKPRLMRIRDFGEGVMLFRNEDVQ